jgi:hypothetical protein
MGGDLSLFYRKNMEFLSYFFFSKLKIGGKVIKRVYELIKWD